MLCNGFKVNTLLAVFKKVYEKPKKPHNSLTLFFFDSFFRDSDSFRISQLKRQAGESV